MPQLLIATQNKGKLKEIKALLENLNFELITPDQVGLLLNIEEKGITYKENAAKKAQVYAKAAGLLTLADDSGLEVEALQGKPGVYSARFSKKPGATDADRRTFLLNQLQSHPQPWKALFRCVVAVYDLKSGVHFSEGVCPGEIIPEERGDHGFGYDPIFLVEELKQTMAELSMAEKNQRSHRARAILAIKPVLNQLSTSS